VSAWTGAVGVLRNLFKGSRGGIELSEAAKRVLQEAERHGYQVGTSERQGVQAIVLQRGGMTVHLWSNDDVMSFARSENWM
jgi:hypothetical protein